MLPQGGPRGGASQQFRPRQNLGRRYVSAIVAVLWCASLLPAAETSDATINDILRKTCDSWHTPGIAAAVVR
ncbi:MAG TPA: hypothetical protein VMF69_14715, partial [Gemmataceae bacterium]|nr:hypothetical protein [Gemmataceae bacterium]